MKKQQGFTLPELLIAMWVVFVVSIAGGLIYAAVHFISKFW